MEIQQSQTALLATMICLLWVVFGPFEPPDPPPRPAFNFETNFKPFVATYCLKCHTASSKVGGVFAINQFPNAKSLLTDKQTWSLAADYLDGHIMPPRDGTQPPDDERKAIATWIRSHLKDKNQ